MSAVPASPTSSAGRPPSGGPSRGRPSGAPTGARPAPALPPRPSRIGPTLAALAAGAVVLLAVADLDIAWGSLGEIPGRVATYLGLLFAEPNWEKLPRALFETWRSVSMAWLGALGCVALSIPLGILAAHGVGPAWVRYPLRGLFAVIRAVPEVVIALILLTVTGLTPFTGALALAIAGIGTQGKWVYETVESVQEGASEAVRAAGGSTAEVARWALWPAAAPSLLSFALYRFEINIRTSAVLGLIGAGGIGTMLSNYTNYREWDTVGMLLIVVVAITMLIDLVSGDLRRRIMEGARPRAVDRTP
ncbi:phosphonate ABC transporter, permease protein PhnE [Brachybacterium saurashtrense]|uniref:Phosphonate ABC transporter, permease protein PhnE n=1 Tax=Brachybacterium saurashtrense TaxID=556288 RepID=A0A345YPN7_9MICO|nr:phosphonate ABC transporter, permease protein PhnE [Brachybacterium saurashtrense]AXK45889.1 phosphonate ABC transporter, permease protein PhnE [Brachybacterium saurashtrense]RRR24908.1 phosphonate ABC transporter, permease protein PhnE [Brachybacterium saurashtrense]